MGDHFIGTISELVSWGNTNRDGVRLCEWTGVVHLVVVVVVVWGCGWVGGGRTRLFLYLKCNGTVTHFISISKGREGKGRGGGINNCVIVKDKSGHAKTYESSSLELSSSWSPVPSALPTGPFCCTCINCCWVAATVSMGTRVAVLSSVISTSLLTLGSSSPTAVCWKQHPPVS